MKRQELRVTRGSLWAAVVYAVISVIEDSYEEDVDMDSILVPAWLLDATKVFSGDVEVEVYYPGHRGVLGEKEVRALGGLVRVRSGSEPADAIGFRSLYRAAAVKPLQVDAAMIRPYAVETSRSGIEFIMLYTETGHVAILEGEHYRVRIPFVKVAVSYHTHPEGSCWLSTKDIESALDLMVEGGIGEGAATVSCAALIYREGFVTENDFVSIKRWIRKPERMPRLESVRLERIAY